jgi:Hydantoinase B/oxoprolinase/Hydantoinase/oxoprolinase C-terminal domain
MEAVTFRLKASGLVERPEPTRERLHSADSSAAEMGRRNVYVDAANAMAPATIYDFRRMNPGNLVRGPAVIHTPITTVVIQRFGNRVCEDDIYLLNDPYTAALHASDVYLVAPVHYEGKLVAWSACFVHINDVGAMNPGGLCPEARDIFSEGFSSPGLRIVQRGEVCEDVLDTLLNMVRSPTWLASIYVR